MSLVDYASLDEEEDREEPEPKVQELQSQQLSVVVVEERRRHVEAATLDQLLTPKLDSPRPQTRSYSQRFKSTMNRQEGETSQQSEPPAFKLPDASLLLNSPLVPSHVAHASDHSSRFATAMAKHESRNRDLNGTSSSSYPRSKVTRGNLPHSKNIPETVGAQLLPHQLTGRCLRDHSWMFNHRLAVSSQMLKNFLSVLLIQFAGKVRSCWERFVAIVDLARAGSFLH